jgi:hypothetical protein
MRRFEGIARIPGGIPSIKIRGTHGVLVDYLTITDVASARRYTLTNGVTLNERSVFRSDGLRGSNGKS